jgi:hypothetical protein
VDGWGVGKYECVEPNVKIQISLAWLRVEEAVDGKWGPVNPRASVQGYHEEKLSQA